MTYPTWRYHATAPPRIIDSPDQEADGWEDSPAAFGIETAPGMAPDADIAANAPALEDAAQADHSASDAQPVNKRKRNARK